MRSAVKDDTGGFTIAASPYQSCDKRGCTKTWLPMRYLIQMSEREPSESERHDFLPAPNGGSHHAQRLLPHPFRVAQQIVPVAQELGALRLHAVGDRKGFDRLLRSDRHIA